MTGNCIEPTVFSPINLFQVLTNTKNPNKTKYKRSVRQPFETLNTKVLRFNQLVYSLWWVDRCKVLNRQKNENKMKTAMRTSKLHSNVAFVTERAHSLR